MQKRIPILLILLILLCALPLSAQPITKQTILPDGMKVIVREDHTAPVVSLMVWVGVGSRNETDANRGVSHFIEHLLFKGTKKRPVGAVSQEVASMGGRINAATSYDFTQFYVEIGSRYFDNALDIFSDVIQNSAFDPAEVERERLVVQEEVRMNRDDPSRRLWQAFTGAAYEKHPYQHPIAGTTESVGAVSRDAILDYFHRYYIPNNMVVTVVGDVSADEAMAKVAKAFSGFTKGPMPSGAISTEPEQKSVRKASESMDVNEATVAIGFHAPTIDNPATYALEVLDVILGGGRSSRLFNDLRERQQIVFGVGSSYETLRDDGLFIVFADTDPARVGQVQTAILDHVKALRQTPVTAQEIKRAKTQLLSQWAFSHETYEQQAEEIGYYEIIGQPTYPENYIRNVNAVTAEDIRKAADRYLNPDSYTVATIVPKSAKEKPETTLEEKRSGKGSDAPKATSSPTFTRLPNGIRVITQESHNADVVSIQLFTTAGTRGETERNNGITTLMQEVIPKGAGNKTAAQIAETLESNGVQFGSNAGEDYSVLSTESTRDGMETGIISLAEMAQKATFPEQEVEKERKQLLNAIAQQENEPESYASKLFEQSFYQKDPYRLNELGTPASVKSITRAELVRYYKEAYRPDRMVIVATGNFDTSKLLRTVQEHFGGMPEAKTHEYGFAPEPARKEPTVVVREKESEQGIVMLGIPAPAMTNSDYAALKVLNTALGSGMNSILFDRVREKLGLAYVVASVYPGKNGPSYVVIQAGTKPGTVDKARDEILATVRDIAEKGLTDKEFQDAKRYYLGNFDLSHQTAEDRAGFLGAYEIRGLGYQYDQKFPKMVEAVTLEDANRAAKKYLSNPGYTLVIVKPKATQ